MSFKYHNTILKDFPEYSMEIMEFPSCITTENDSIKSSMRQLNSIKNYFTLIL